MGKMTVYVYTIPLVGGKYFVGWCRNVEDALRQHRLGRLGPWTKTYPPTGTVGLLSSVHNIHAAKFAVEKRVLELMRCHGVDNVRGAPYDQMELSKYDLAEIAHPDSDHGDDVSSDDDDEEDDGSY